MIIDVTELVDGMELLIELEIGGGNLTLLAELALVSEKATG